MKPGTQPCACCSTSPCFSVDALGDEATLGSTRHEGADGDHRTRMKIILGGLVESSDLPPWPLDPDHGTTDQRRLAVLAKALDLYCAGYSEIVEEVLELSESPIYRRLHVAIAHTLEQHGQLDAVALRRIKALGEEKDMQHLLTQGDCRRHRPGRLRGRHLHGGRRPRARHRRRRRHGQGAAEVEPPIPLAWNHGTGAEDIFVGWTRSRPRTSTVRSSPAARSTSRARRAAKPGARSSPAHSASASAT